MRTFEKFAILLFIVVLLLASFSSALAEKKEPIEINTLVIPSRNHTRMQPEIFYAFKHTEKRMDPLLEMEFTVFNPFQHDVIEDSTEFQMKLKKFMDLLNKCVPEVVSVKKANPGSDELWPEIHKYIKTKPDSYLARLNSKIEELMEDFDFLIIESSDTYGIHPMFYQPDVIQMDTPEGATWQDIIETLYGLFFLDAAFKQNKPVWGTCHGAQIGYVHAGGKLGRIFEYKDGGYNISFKKDSRKDGGEEIWHIGKVLSTQKMGTEYFEHGEAIYPVPEIFKGNKDKKKQMYLNKDFEHSLVLREPVPDDIKVISYHPLSKLQENNPGKKYEEFNKKFKTVFKNQVIVDAYQYKTMIGTQYHPQYTYDDLETAIIFEYLVKQIADRYKDKE
jgi:gamma-glutamyl-gamma-aminobutyrate hydrolase PuuD